MQVYLAPMEGITGYVFRNAYAKYYGGVDKYFTPFITPHTKKNMDMREKRDILPENNKGIYVVPQVLTNKAEELIDICKELKEYGYEEVNLNIGCPSKTVTAKGKGSGFLEFPDRMEEFFDRFFKASDTKLSIKTRIGVYELEEAERLFRLFERFPFEEVIVHPRLTCEFYQGKAHREMFEEYLKNTGHSLCYNGDINTLEDLQNLDKQWKKCDKFMLGRGLIANPGMLCASAKEDLDLQSAIENAGKVSDEAKNGRERFLNFHDELLTGYQEYLSGDRNVLFRMKELWGWWQNMFPEQAKLMKQIKKSNDIAEYKMLVNQLHL